MRVRVLRHTWPSMNVRLRWHSAGEWTYRRIEEVPERFKVRERPPRRTC
jgi:hypothetical protein